MQHADAGGDGFCGGVKGHGRFVDPDRAAVFCLVAGEDLHQGRFARPILTQQTVHAPWFQDERDAVVCSDRSKIFLDVV
jgi:hypothetical protein